MVEPITEKRPKKHDESDNPKPTRSFKDVLSRLTTPPPNRRHKSVFDLPSQKEKKREESATNSTFQHAVIAEQEVLPIELPSFSTDLSVQMHELMEKMVDRIFMESKNGISTTTILIDTENPLSLFNDSIITIEHYDTAPHSFNIQLSGSAQAVDEFVQYLPSLQAQLTERLAGFQVELLRPTLIQNKSFTSKRIGKTEHKKKDAKIKKIHYC